MIASFQHIDNNIDQMINILKDDMHKLDKSFDSYLNQIRRQKKMANENLLAKLSMSYQVFELAKQEILELTELLEPLKNIKQVNKMVSFSLKNCEEFVFIKINSFLGSIANICLGQLKYIRSRYNEILQALKSKIKVLWMDRELAKAIRLILSVNQIQYNKFLHVFKDTEVLYADISLSIKNTKTEDFHERIVLRMVSNRLPSAEEQRIIQLLFPSWNEEETMNHIV